MRRIFCLLILLVCYVLLQSQNYDCSFTILNPSASGIAFGYIGGGADIYNQNPLDVWSNPAKLGYYKGISFGYSNDNWFDEVQGLEGMYLNSSYLTIGWKGMGIMIPMINKYGKMGTTFSYGEDEYYDYEEDTDVSFEPTETNAEIAFGINLLEFIKEDDENTELYKINKYTEISLGYNYNLIVSQYETYPDKSSAFLDGLGIIWRLSPLNGEVVSDFEHVKMDIVLSLYKFNMSRTTIEIDGYDNPLPYSTKTAFSLRFAYALKSLQNVPDNNIYKTISLFSKDLVSIYSSFNRENSMNSSISYGKGIEFAFLDIISFRYGHYSDPSGDLSGNTSGIGLNLHYKELLHLQYNWAKFPGGDLQEFQKKNDFMLNVNLWNLLGME